MHGRSLWMPFTAEGAFWKSPRTLDKADGVFYQTDEGHRVLDAVSGLWCVNIGHGRARMAEMVARQISELDYAPMFQMGHHVGFNYADRLLAFAPPGFGRAFLVNSGSEAVDTALKLALKFHKARGEGARTRLIGRERAYHGVGFGGISVGGMPANRRDFGPLLPGVDHLQHTHGLAENLFSRGQPAAGAHLAQGLERIIALHDASTIAAVIVEPVAGSAGVLVPPVGYLEKLREITARHGILLIFDEVISGFGRVGSPFASQRLGVIPDMIVAAKAITNGTIPMGAVLLHGSLVDAFHAKDDEIGLYHGHTASAHPVACAAANCVLDAMADESLLQRARELEPTLERAMHGLRHHALAADIRNFGLMAAVELHPDEGAPGHRGQQVLQRCYEKGVLVRATGDTIALAPALVSQPGHISLAVEILDDVLTHLH